MRRVVAGMCLVLACAAAARSGEDSNGVTDAERERFAGAAARLLERGLTDLHAMALLGELCTEAPRRLSGSKSIAAAEAWAKRAMTEAGLANVRHESVTVPHWVRGEVADLVIGYENDDGGLSFAPLPVLALGGSVGTPEDEGVSAAVIEVKSFEELETRADDARGKIVFFNRPMDPTLPRPGTAYGRAVDQRMRGAIEAAKAGAVAAIVRSLSTRIDDVPHTGVMKYEEAVERIPAVAVSTEGADRLSRLLREGRRPEARLTLDCRNLPDTHAHTVIGELEGTTKKDEIVLIGAHLDAWDVGQGAHDDGAGCVHAIEAVRLLHVLGLRPKRTIRVVLYACEEQGIFGGRAYAKEHAEELARHVMAIESDAGGFTPRGFGTNASDEARAILQAVTTGLEPVGADRVTKGGGGADISPLGPSGVVLVGLRPDTQRYFDYHHSESDTLDQVNERELELGAVAIATLAYAVADLETTLPRNPRKETK